MQESKLRLAVSANSGDFPVVGTRIPPNHTRMPVACLQLSIAWLFWNL